jgi:hypothetical protein
MTKAEELNLRETNKQLVEEIMRKIVNNKTKKLYIATSKIVRGGSWHYNAWDLLLPQVSIRKNSGR